MRIEEAIDAGVEECLQSGNFMPGRNGKRPTTRIENTV